MNNIRLRLAHPLLAAVLVGTVVFAAFPAVATPDHGASSQAAMPKPGTGNFVQRLINELRSSGLEVSVGYPTLWNEADCAYSYPVYHNCFGNNPAAPYVVPVVKPWPEEYVDPAMVNGLGRTRPGYSVTYRLDPREAIIFFGRMPPPARYIGLQTWIWTTGWVSETSPWNEEAYNDYADAAIPDLKYAESDAQAVYDTLADPAVGRFLAANVTLLLGRQATPGAITAALYKLRGAGRDDLAVISYSGHTSSPGVFVVSRRPDRPMRAVPDCTVQGHSQQRKPRTR